VQVLAQVVQVGLAEELVELTHRSDRDQPLAPLELVLPAEYSSRRVNPSFCFLSGRSLPIAYTQPWFFKKWLTTGISV
jgi:hypothetical protein